MTKIFSYSKRISSHVKDILCILLLSLTIFLTFLQADAIREGMLSTFSLAYKSLIPSLYPFMILSGVCMHFLNSKEETVRLKFSKRKRKHLALPFIFSILFGFPIGACVVSDLYNRNRVNKGVCNRLFPLFNQCSFSFVTLVVGREFSSSFYVGLQIYAVMIFSSLLVYLLFQQQDDDTFSVGYTKENVPFSLLSIIKKSTMNMLYIVGFLIAFSIPCALVQQYFTKRIVSVLLAVGLEMTNGCRMICKYFPADSIFRLPFLCFCVSFGGACIGMQSQLCQENGGFSMKEYYIRKFLQAIFAFLFGFFIR